MIDNRNKRQLYCDRAYWNERKRERVRQKEREKCSKTAQVNWHDLNGKFCSNWKLLKYLVFIKAYHAKQNPKEKGKKVTILES